MRALAITSSPTRFTRLSIFCISTLTVSETGAVAGKVLRALSIVSFVTMPFSTMISPIFFAVVFPVPLMPCQGHLR